MEPSRDYIRTSDELQTMTKEDLINYIHINIITYGSYWLSILLHEMSMEFQPKSLLTFIQHSQPHASRNDIRDLSLISRKLDKAKLKKKFKTIKRLIEKIEKAQTKLMKRKQINKGKASAGEYQCLLDSP